uniref:Probable imidazolonepropionase n=1 Tax=Ciona savignyi TaxID=51511 RepID=H2ZCE3_CIOSA
MMESGKLLITGVKQIVQVCNQGERVLVGSAMHTVAVMESNNVTQGYSIVIDHEGNIAGIDTDENIRSKFSETKFSEVLDATGCSVIPGLVDAHTHPVWTGDRVHEFAMKLAGSSYMDVHKAGGGIHYTVEHTRAASENQLYQLFKNRLISMIKSGTTLVECKSGYGLDTDSELKMLHVIDQARHDTSVQIDVSSTYCGAHAVPKGSTSEEAVNDVVMNQLPAIKREIDTGKLAVENIDVFCEKGVFDVHQTRKILEEGKKIGLLVNFHGDELTDTGSEEISDVGIKAMSKSQTVAVILPTTAYILRWAIPLIMHLACVNFHMTMPEALSASTINAAAALGMSGTHGSLEIGKRGNLVIINAPR